MTFKVNDLVKINREHDNHTGLHSTQNIDDGFIESITEGSPKPYAVHDHTHGYVGIFNEKELVLNESGLMLRSIGGGRREWFKPNREEFEEFFIGADIGMGDKSAYHSYAKGDFPVAKEFTNGDTPTQPVWKMAGGSGYGYKAFDQKKNYWYLVKSEGEEPHWVDPTGEKNRLFGQPDTIIIPKCMEETARSILESKPSPTTMGEEFKEGDMVEIIRDCSGTKIGDHYRLKYGSEKRLFAGNCWCPEYWRKVKTSEKKEDMTETIFPNDLEIVWNESGKFKLRGNCSLGDKVDSTDYIWRLLRECSDSKGYYFGVYRRHDNILLSTCSGHDIKAVDFNNNSSFIGKIMHNITDYVKSAMLSKEEKLLRKHSLKDAQGNFTQTAKDLVNAKIMQDNEDYLVKCAEDFEKELEKEKK